jgi:hypothetical protein
MSAFVGLFFAKQPRPEDPTTMSASSRASTAEAIFCLLVTKTTSAARPIRQGMKKIAAHRDDQGELSLRSAACTHVGCHLHFNGFERCWDCPCHGSIFDTDFQPFECSAIKPLGTPLGTDEPQDGLMTEGTPMARRFSFRYLRSHPAKPRFVRRVEDEPEDALEDWMAAAADVPAQP